jgi:hypothetical protein
MDEQKRRNLARLSARLRLTELEQQEVQEMSEDAVTVLVGADVGNATSIIAVAVGNTVKVEKMPTAAAFSLALPAKLEPDDHVFYDAHGVPSRAVGMAALRYVDGEVVTARGSQDRYGSFMVDFIVAGVAAQVRAPRIVVPVLAVTVPAKYHGEVKDTVVKALRKTHSRVYRGRPVSVEVRSVLVYQEAEAALASLADKAKGSTILIDGGGGQTHVALARDGKLRSNPVTRETGLQRVIDKADDVIYAKHSRRLLPLERYELERALKDSKDYFIIVAGQRTKVSHYATEQYDQVAPLIISDIQSIVPKWRNAETIILAGGQAFHLRKQYSEAFPGLIVADKPDERNARGALLLAGATEAQDANAA